MTDVVDELELFLRELHRQEVSERTVLAYASDLRAFGRWFEQTLGEPFRAASVTETDVRDHKAYLQTVAGKKPRTVNRRLAGLRKFFAWAQARRLVAESPTAGVRGMGAVALAPKALEKREVDKLIRTVQRHGSKRDVAIIQLLRHTGLRAGELCALNLTDVATSERKGQVVVRSGKGAKYRAVPLNATVRTALDAYLNVRPDVASPAFFLNQRGGRVGHTAVEGVVAKYARLAGLADVTPHTLRHTFGKGALDAGANLVAVAALLGHADIKTTAIYTQPTVRDLEDVVQRLEGEQR
jgi:integrase/recombinase XerC